MTFAFETLDGLVAVADCPDIESPGPYVMRPMWKHPPVFGKEPDPLFQRYRRYERTSRELQGHIVYREVYD